MTLQLTERERQTLEWFLERQLPSLRTQAAYSDDRLVRRSMIGHLEELQNIATLIENLGVREAA